jgi:hypothetical protein
MGGHLLFSVKVIDCGVFSNAGQTLYSWEKPSFIVLYPLSIWPDAVYAGFLHLFFMMRLPALSLFHIFLTRL